jgi:polysaccharide export outer membrane protein
MFKTLGPVGSRRACPRSRTVGSHQNATSTPVRYFTHAGLALVLAAGTLTLVGCGNSKSFLDPSVAGSWNGTPTVMPILDRLAAIEDDKGDMVDISSPVAEDLIPRPTSYRIGPGDVLSVTIFDLISPNEREEYEVSVDARGMIEIPQLGRIEIVDRTTEEAMEAVVRTIRDRNLIQDPLVQVLAISQRRQTFTVVGAVQSPGLYPIPRADYRALEALAAAGAFNEGISEIYIIRQVPLSDDVITGISGPTTTRPSRNAQPAPDQPAQPTGEDLLNVIDDIAPGADAKTAPKPNAAPAASPSMMRSAQAQGGGFVDSTREPELDLINSEPIRPQTEDGSTWIYVNDKWMKVKTAPSSDVLDPANRSGDSLITQRIIRISLRELLAGRQSINVVIRPGDVVRFPASDSGFVYMGGQVARPGPYNMTPGFTLSRAIIAAGGYSEIAIPSRIDITRMVGEARQATMRLDGVAISENRQPDIFLKPGDMINVGSSGWALPLAVIRNGFRASYGFGFILDRNLADDIFGPPPTNNFNQ